MHPPKRIWDFSRFGLSIKSWKLAVMHPPKQIWDFSRFGLSIKSWKLAVMHTPPPPKRVWDFSRFGLSIKSWKLAVMHPLHQADLRFSRFGLSIKSWKLAVMHPPSKRIWDFSRFGLSIKSWKLGVMHPVDLRKLIFDPRRSIFLFIKFYGQNGIQLGLYVSICWLQLIYDCAFIDGTPEIYWVLNQLWILAALGSWFVRENNAFLPPTSVGGAR